MSFTTEQLDALDRAIASGRLRVRMNGEEVQYRTLDEMLRARAVIAASLNQARVTHMHPTYDPGT